MIILAIESSCDETSVAVTNERKILSNVISTQISEHRLYGGVVPEIASRRHTEAISAVCNEALKKSGKCYNDIDAIAVTFAPGLIGALLVGVNFAKGLAMSLSVPLIPVHHLRSHMAANYICNPQLKPPFMCLLVSGGNTVIAEVTDYTKFKIIGSTRDDAAGECFDKTARCMGLQYPGGVTLDKIATQSDFKKYPLPFPHVSSGEFDFSFSGLKTSVMNIVHNVSQKGEEINVPVLCATVRERVCDLLIENTLKAMEKYNYNIIAVAGGVSANSELRRRLDIECTKKKYKLYYPPIEYCGDNAAMVGVQAYYEYLDGNLSGSDLNAKATLPIDYR